MIKNYSLHCFFLVEIVIIVKYLHCFRFLSRFSMYVSVFVCFSLILHILCEISVMAYVTFLYHCFLLCIQILLITIYACLFNFLLPPVFTIVTVFLNLFSTCIMSCITLTFLHVKKIPNFTHCSFY